MTKSMKNSNSRLGIALFSFTRVRFYIGQVADALCYLHDTNLIYREYSAAMSKSEHFHSLKAENVCLKPNGYVKLTDFGLVLKRRPGQQTQKFGRCGTYEYFAPEMAADLEYNEKIDWWALGTQLLDAIGVMSAPRRAYLCSIDGLHAISGRVLGGAHESNR
jgi:serine/threonine protein kinase